MAAPNKNAPTVNGDRALLVPTDTALNGAAAVISVEAVNNKAQHPLNVRTDTLAAMPDTLRRDACYPEKGFIIFT